MGVAEPDVDLTRIVSIAEFEPVARAVMDRVAFDYVAGGGWDEQSLGDAEAAWRRRRLRPRVLVDVDRVDPATTLLGRPSSLPIAIAPMAAQGLAHPSHGRDGAAGYDILVEDLDRGLAWTDLATIRSWSPLPIVLRGILTAEDARLAVEHGIDGVAVSNHGARQLDRTVTTADALEPIVDAVAGRTEVWIDGGIRRGLDVVTALALGARGVLVGRPMFRALAAGGQAGVERALAILRTETILAMTLLGAPTPGDLGCAHGAG